MRTVFLLSDSIGQLDRNLMTQSSQKYEFDLATSLSNSANTIILSSSIEFPFQSEQGRVTLIGCKKGANKYGAIEEILKSYPDSILIFWGYDLKKVLEMLRIARKLSVSVIPFIYDSHKVAVSVYPFIKRMLAEVYFGLGRFCLRGFKKIILFQENAAKLLHFHKKPYLVIKPGAVDLNIKPSGNKDGVFNVTYCGSLTHLNGIDSLVESFGYFEGKNIKFTICGSGPLTNLVKDAAQSFDFVDYLGVVDDNKVREIYSNSDLLLNLRRNDDDAMNYAFPSKFFESICSGVPIVTCKLIDDFEINDNVYIINKISAREISEVIIKVYSDRENGKIRAHKARDYLLKEYSFDKSAQAIISFISYYKRLIL